MTELTPQEIVRQLDKHIVGQSEAKRAVAIALRNRWRRAQVDENLRHEITPKNILMIGPTGVGKTEIARRLSKLAGAPFVKVEATKFTEVGYVGRDVESIIRDLVDASVNMERDVAMEQVKDAASDSAEERILDALLTPARAQNTQGVDSESETRQRFRKMLREGTMDDREIEIDVRPPSLGVEIMAPPGMEEMTNQLQSMFQSVNQSGTRNRRLKIFSAKKIIMEEECAKLINEEDIRASAVENAEQNGIVFLDEIDKVAKRSEATGPDISREGVQRDLLPLVEGCSVSTKHGMVRTDHILFIASGAFHFAKPSDLIPELQGRLPNRVELEPLTVEDFVKILTEPDASLSQQYTALLKTERVNVSFEEDGIRKLAECAYDINERTENIGARRLHTVMERLFEALSFTASEMRGQSFRIDSEYVENHISKLASDEDLARYIL